MCVYLIGYRHISLILANAIHIWTRFCVNFEMEFKANTQRLTNRKHIFVNEQLKLQSWLELVTFRSKETHSGCDIVIFK